MIVSTVLSLVSGHVKLATAVAATAAITAGGGAAVTAAVTADNSHATRGLEKAASAKAGEKSRAAKTAEVDLPPCPADVKNHGAYVSSVAKMKFGPNAAPNAHGKLVSAAAKSDCGKPPGGGDDAEENKTERRNNLRS